MSSSDVTSAQNKGKGAQADRSVFPGLNPYLEKDQDLFCGREHQVMPLLGKLVENRFVSLQGSSGVGKTSFSNCQVLPTLRKGFLAQGMRSWRVAYMTPGVDPLSALAIALSSKELTNTTSSNKVEASLSVEFEERLRNSHYGLVDILSDYRLTDGANLLLFVDQLDELNVLSKPDQAAIFIQRLIEVSEQSAYPLHILTCSRSEVVGAFSAYAKFAELLNRHHYLLPPLHSKDLINTVERVAETQPVVFRKALIDRLLDHYKQGPVDLVSFQHAMRRCIDRVAVKDGTKTIGVIHLKTVGGIGGSIAVQAEEVYNDLPVEEQQVARSVFQAITGLSEQGVGVSVPRRVHKIIEFSACSEVLVLKILRAFGAKGVELVELVPVQSIEGRLEKLDQINRPDVSIAKSAIVRLKREQIIEAWPRLSSWISEEGEDAARFVEIAESAQKNDHFYMGEKLQSMWTWYERKMPTEGWGLRYHRAYKPAINFLEGSKKESDRIAEIRKAEEISRQQKAARNKRIIAGVLLIAIILLIVSIIEKIDADTQSEKAQLAEMQAIEASERAATDSTNAALAVIRAMQAVRKADTSEQNAKWASIEAEEAKQRAMQLRREAEQLSSEVRSKEEALAYTIKKMNRSKLLEEYLALLSSIRELSEESTKILSRADLDEQLRDGADLALKGYELFNLTQRDQYISIQDSVKGMTELARKRLFSSMNLAVQKVGKNELLGAIHGGVAATRVAGVDKVASGVYLVGTNDQESNVHLITVRNGEAVSAKEVTQARVDEKKVQGIKTICVDKAAEHFAIVHVPTVQNVHHVSFHRVDGQWLSSLEFETLIQAVYPIGQRDFLAVAKNASIYWLHYKGAGKYEVETLDRSNNVLLAVDFEPVTSQLTVVQDKGDIKVYTLEEGRLVDFRELSLSRKVSTTSAVKLVQEKGWLVVGNRAGAVSFYDAESGVLLHEVLNEHANRINVLQLGSNDKWIVSGSRDGVVSIWDVDAMDDLIEKSGGKGKLEPVQFVEENSIRDVSFISEEWLMVVSSDEGLSDYHTGRVSILPLDFHITGKELEKLL